MTLRGIQVRLFLTCWVIYALHFATEFIREHYLVVSIVEDRSFDLGKYYGINPDIFRNPPNAPHGGTHQGANPGISMMGALVYAPLRPAVEWIVRRELASRGAVKDTMATFRDETRQDRLRFYRQTRAMGLDVRFGLVAMITAVLCMAPLTAASVVVVFRILGGLGITQKAALALSFVYAFATPTFFRSSYLNHNLAIAVFSIAAFLLLWNPGDTVKMPAARRQILAGALGGLCLLNDYSGALSLALLGLYLLWREWREHSPAEALRAGLRYGAAAVPSILLLWFYQWQSFGNPFYPPQHWMPPVDWSDVGYQGVGGMKLELFNLLLFDHRFGLFVCAPLLALAVVTPFLARRRPLVPVRELVLCYAIAAAYLAFFSAVQYTRLQYVSGGPRYLLPAVPFLFLASLVTLLRMPKVLAYGLVFVTFVISWSMTMVRSHAGVLDNVQQTLIGGLRLNALQTFSRMSSQYAPWLTGYASPYPALLVTAVVIWAIWRLRRPWAPAAEDVLAERQP